MDIVNTVIGERLVYALGWTILHSLWQCGLIALLLAAILFSSNRASANFRYLISFAAMFLCLALSIKTFFDFYDNIIPINLSNGNTEAQNSIYVIYANFSESLALTKLLENHLTLIVIFWLCGFLLSSALTLKQYWFCSRLKSHGTVKLPEAWQSKAKELQSLIGLKRNIQIRLSMLVDCPCVVGHLKPVVLLPFALLSQMQNEQIELILLHEFAHIRRNDYFFNLVQRAIKILFFFNPLLIWISSRIDAERENACDDEAIELKGNPLLYAQTLKDFAMLNTTNIGMRFGAKKHSVLSRIQRLFEHSVFSRKPLDGIIAIFLVTLCCLFVNAYASDSRGDQEEQIAYEFTSLADVKVRALFEKGKSQAKVNEENGHYYFNLEGDKDLHSLNAGEKRLLLTMLSLGQSEVFSHLDFDELKNTATLIQKNNDPKKIDKKISEAVTLTQSNTNKALAEVRLQNDSTLQQIIFSPEFIRRYEAKSIPSVENLEKNYLLIIDQDQTLIFIQLKTKISKEVVTEKAASIIESLKEATNANVIVPPSDIKSFYSMSFVIDPNPVEGKDPADMVNFPYEHHIRLIDTEYFSLIILPRTALFDSRKLNKPNVIGSYNLGITWKDDSVILYVDFVGSQKTNEEMRKHLNDSIFAAATPDPKVEQAIADLDKTVGRWLFSEEELEFIRTIAGELRGFEVGMNEFSYQKNTIRKIDLDAVKDKTSEDFLKDGRLNAPRYFYGMGSPGYRMPTRVLVRPAKYQEAPAHLVSMDKREVAISEILFEARKTCPDDTLVTQLENPETPITFIVTDLTCGEVNKLIQDLDDEAGLTKE